MADVVLFAACTGAMALEDKASMAWTAYPSVYRWYCTMKSLDSVTSAVSKVEALQKWVEGSHLQCRREVGPRGAASRSC